MSAHHFFTPDVTGDEVRLTGDEAHHAARALRIEPGEEISVSDGRGTVVRAKTVSVTRGELRAEVIDRTEVPHPQPRVEVCPAVPKGSKLEQVIEDLTELGVDAITPWLAQRSIPRWDAARAQAHLERWRKVALAAAKQSRRAWLPEIEGPRPPEVGEGTVVLHEGTEDRLSEVLPKGPVRLVIGPEGGLTSEEASGFTQAGARLAGLGPQVLRAQTAAVAAAVLALSRAGRSG